MASVVSKHREELGQQAGLPFELRLQLKLLYFCLEYLVEMKLEFVASLDEKLSQAQVQAARPLVHGPGDLILGQRAGDRLRADSPDATKIGPPEIPDTRAIGLFWACAEFRGAVVGHDAHPFRHAMLAPCAETEQHVVRLPRVRRDEQRVTRNRQRGVRCRGFHVAALQIY